MRDCYFSAFVKYCPDCPQTKMSPYFHWKQAHPKEYELFKNEASEALLRAMYNYNHKDAPAIVKFEPNYLDLDDNSMHVNPPKTKGNAEN